MTQLGLIDNVTTKQMILFNIDIRITIAKDADFGRDVIKLFRVNQ